MCARYAQTEFSLIGLLVNLGEDSNFPTAVEYGSKIV